MWTVFLHTWVATKWLGPFIVAAALAYYQPFGPTDVLAAAAIAAVPFLAALNR